MGDVSLDEMAALGNLVCYPSSTPEEARERVRDADVACLNKVVVDQAFLDAAPQLKLICEAGTGINNIDVKLCEERGIAVRNVAAYSTDSVAQIAWMHILNLSGRAFHYRAFVQSGAYSRNSVHVDYAHPFTEIAGKTLGVVGMGAIGQKVAAVGKAFGMEVIYYSTSGTSHCTDYPSVSLDELLRRSDVISIHAPYNERTAGLIGYEQLCKMKPSAILVNTGRGGIVVRSKYTYDKSNHCIDITEIPPTTTSEAIIDKIIDKAKSGSLKEISDIRDETDKNGLKITIDVKRGTDPDKLMRKLFKMTPLEDSFPCNFNVLIGGMPRVLGVTELLQEYLYAHKLYHWQIILM